MEDAVLIVRISDEVGGFFYDRLGIRHGNSKPGIFDHGQIVEAVPAADHLVRVEAQSVEEFPEGVCLIDILGHDLQKVRFGFINIQETVILLFQILHQNVKGSRISGDQQFVHGKGERRRKIIHNTYRHAVDGGFFFCVLIRADA